MATLTLKMATRTTTSKRRRRWRCSSVRKMPLSLLLLSVQVFLFINIIIIVSAQRQQQHQPYYYSIFSAAKKNINKEQEQPLQPSDVVDSKAIGFDPNDDQEEEEDEVDVDGESLSGGQNSNGGDGSGWEDGADTTTANDDCLSIVDTVCALRGGFDTACRLFTTYQDELFGINININYTAFVPTDAAFEAIADSLPFDLLGGGGKENSTTTTTLNLLQFHLVASSVKASDLTCQKRLTMTNGMDSRTVCRKTDDATTTTTTTTTTGESSSSIIPQKFQKGGDNIEPVPIIIQDLQPRRACRTNAGGVIHIINGVLLPEGIFGEEVVVVTTTEEEGSDDDDESTTTTTVTTIPAETVSTQQPVPVPECLPILDFICGSRVLSHFCTLLKQYNLKDDLREATSITVFAPYNLAFSNGMNNNNNNNAQGLFFSSFEELDFDTARDILIFHASSGTITTTADLECDQLLEMANGMDTRTICSSSSNTSAARPRSLLFQKGAGNTAEMIPKLLVKDVAVCQGVVHVVDRILLPYEVVVPPSRQRRQRSLLRR